MSLFVAYITAGDGGLSRSLECMLALAKGGVDMIEVGVPFSDPVADGPTIAAAASRSLENGTTLEDIFQLVKQFRQQSNVPIILFSYYNPLLQFGLTKCLKAAASAGINASLVVDLPIEEADDYQACCLKEGIDPIYIVSTSTPDERIATISAYSKRMLYYACRRGTTGVRSGLPDGFSTAVSRIKTLTHLPVVAGFGIADRESSAEVLASADGFVVGSLFVEAIAKGISPEKLTQMARDLIPSQEKVLS